MNTLNKTIGSFEAKTHFSHLLSDVQNGQEYIITKRGVPVAKLVGFESDKKESLKEALRKLDKIREASKLRNPTKINIKEYINSGRKYL